MDRPVRFVSWSSLCVSLLTLALSPAASGQLPAARLWHLNPAGAKAGSSVEVALDGADLEGATTLRFSHAGIQATNVGTNRFNVTVAASVPPGIYDARAIGKHGASNPRAFSVGSLKELPEGINSLEMPLGVPLGSVISGRLEPNGVDCFRFAATKDQRIVVQCDARAIDSKLEPVLALVDAGGRVLKRSRTGGLLHHTASEDGELTVQLHDVTYRGGADFYYRLSIGALPHIEFLLPAEGQPAAGKGVFTAWGHNIGGEGGQDSRANAGLERKDFELGAGVPGVTPASAAFPAQFGADLFEFRVTGDSSVSAPALFRLPTARVLVEDERNNSKVTAQDIALPCEISGQFVSNADRDWFSFEARKGDVYWIEVFSHRLGHPTDPLLIVQRVTDSGATDVLELNDSEPNVGGADFNTTHRDPAGRLEVKQDGRYLVHVRDVFTHPPETRGLAYQLVIRKPAPDFRLVALPVAPPPPKKDAKDILVGTTALRRGQVHPIKVVALRREGFNRAIDVTAADLPKGVAAAPARIESGKHATLLYLSVGEDIPAAFVDLKVQGTAEIDGTKTARDARAATQVWNVADPQAEPVVSRGTSAFAFSTTDDLFPVRLAPAEDKTWEVAAGGKLKIPLQLSADGEVSGTFKLKPVTPTAFESAKEFDFNPKATNSVFEIDAAQQKLEPGTYQIVLQGNVSVKLPVGKGDKKTKETSLTLCSGPIHLKVLAPPAAKPPPAAP